MNEVTVVTIVNSEQAELVHAAYATPEDAINGIEAELAHSPVWVQPPVANGDGTQVIRLKDGDAMELSEYYRLETFIVGGVL